MAILSPALIDAVAWQAEILPGTSSSVGFATPPFRTIEDVSGSDTGVLRDLLAYQDRFATGMDDRVRGAHLAAFFYHHLAIAAGAVFLKAGLVPVLAPSSLSILFEPADRSGRRRLQVRFAAISEERTSGAFAAGFAFALQPVISAITRETGLSAAAQWRLAADGVAGAFLEIGRAMDDEARAICAAMEIVRGRQTPLHASATDIRLLGDTQPRAFLLRGGCCLYYRTEGGTFCDSCVLRDDRDARLAAHLSVTGLR